MVGHATPTTNIIVPVTITTLTPGDEYAKIDFAVDLEKQYYANAEMEFKIPEPSCLRMVHMPIYSALKKVGGRWQEVYDQDERFQQIGAVTESPSWDVSLTDQRRLLTTVIPARIEMQYYDFVKSVREQYTDSHDVVLEIFGKSFVQNGYPKKMRGILQYGLVDFELIRFEALYIVPKGGPSGARYLS